jgi:hypothetical protein
MVPTPMVFHFNNPEWRKTQHRAMASIERLARNFPGFGLIGGAPDLEIITCNSQAEPSLTQRCLSTMGVPFHWLGRGIRPWKNAYKLTLCNDFVQNSLSRYVLHLDANDVLLLGSPSEILRRFLTINCELLFNAEVYFYFNECTGFDSDECVRLGQDIRAHQLSAYSAQAARRRSVDCRCPMHLACNDNQFIDGIWRGGYTYLNSGCWIGNTDFLKGALPEALRMSQDLKVFRHDQPYMHILHYRYYPQIRIDNHCSIFQSGTLCHDYDFYI